MITIVTQGVMSPLYKFPSREYSFRSTVILIRIVCVNANAREFSRLFLPTLPLNRAVHRRHRHRRRRRWRKGASTFWFYGDPSSHRAYLYLRFFATRESLYGFIVNETTTWIKKLDSDDSGGGVGNDWPRAQINSRLDACTWRLRNNMKSDGLLRVYCHWRVTQ